MRRLLVALLLTTTPVAALAQSVGGNASLSVTTASGNVALPAATTSYPALLIVPAPSSTGEVFYNFGTSNAVAALTTGPALPAGGLCLANVGAAQKYLAAITATGTATLRITQMAQCPQLYSGASGSSGSVSGTFTQTSPSVGGATIATGQYSNATGSATQIVAARTGAPGTGRVSITLYNSSLVNCFIGVSGVLTSTGARILPGGSYTLYTTAALYSVPASGTCTLDYLETY